MERSNIQPSVYTKCGAVKSGTSHLITVQTDANVNHNLHFIDLHHSVSAELLKELYTLEI